MKFSLILGTVGRISELERNARALDAQTCRDFELILVDQNLDDRLLPFVQQFGLKFPILHLRSRPGLSRARNVGLEHATGQIIAFPDDDCWYPPDLLRNVAFLLDQHPEWDGIAGRCIDENGVPSINDLDHIPGRVARLNAMRRHGSQTLFVRRRLIDRVGGFDVDLGPGASSPFTGGEDADFVARAVAARCHIRFLPSVQLYHRQVFNGYSAAARDKRMHYSMAGGYLLRKNRYPLIFFILLPIAEGRKCVLALLRGRVPEALFQWANVVGLLRGWLGI